VLPGEYVIHARRIEVTVGPAAVSVPTTIREFVAQPVIVGDGDVGPIAVRTSAGSRLEGRVVLEGAPSQVAPPAFNLWTLPEDPDLAQAVDLHRAQPPSRRRAAEAEARTPRNMP
jgi:hypothetical protein